MQDLAYYKDLGFYTDPHVRRVYYQDKVLAEDRFLYRPARKAGLVPMAYSVNFQKFLYRPARKAGHRHKSIPPTTGVSIQTRT